MRILGAYFLIFTLPFLCKKVFASLATVFPSFQLVQEVNKLIIRSKVLFKQAVSHWSKQIIVNGIVVWKIQNTEVVTTHFHTSKYVFVCITFQHGIKHSHAEKSLYCVLRLSSYGGHLSFNAVMVLVDFSNSYYTTPNWTSQIERTPLELFLGLAVGARSKKSHDFMQ